MSDGSGFVWAPGVWDDIWADGVWANGGPPPPPPVAARIRLGTHFRGPLLPGEYTTFTVPDPLVHRGAFTYVHDGDGGSPCLAVSDGFSWRRIALGAPLVPPTPGDAVWAAGVWAPGVWDDDVWSET